MNRGKAQTESPGHMKQVDKMKLLKNFTKVDCGEDMGETSKESYHFYVAAAFEGP